MNSIVNIPVLSEPFPNIPETWLCPKTGLLIPKKPIANILWREKLLRKAENDTGLQKELINISTESVLAWINTFVWTFHAKDIDDKTFTEVPAIQAHNPMITWEIQDELITALEFAILTGEDILITKSRQMGASWICITVFDKVFLFRPDSILMEFSRVEDYVDKDGEPKCLFWKHDYIHKWLPDWMCPPGIIGKGASNRRKLRIDNILNGSKITGESTTKHAASGANALALLLDEFSKVDNGAAIRSATADVAPCRVVNSTPAGAGTEYSRWKNSGQIKVFVLPYWEHPIKGAHRYVHKNEATEKYEIRSPWFDGQCERRSKRELAQEILMQDIESGNTFFNIENIDKHIAKYGRKPLSQWDIDLKEEIPNSKIANLIRQRDKKCFTAKRNNKGKLSIWTKLIDGRPDQTKTYVFGIDLSKGQGASASVVSIKCKQTGQKIGEWYDNNTPPYEMARIVVALALWCGGRNPHRLPSLKWEMNGPGWDFGKLMVKIFYYPYYYRQKTTGEISTKQTKKYGWHSSNPSKYELMSLYNRILAHGGYYNPCIAALEEAKLYIEYEGNRILPASLIGNKEDVNSKAHGDRVIADALTLDEKDLKVPLEKERNAPKRSFGGRYENFMRKKKKNKSLKKGFQRSYDFSC